MAHFRDHPSSMVRQLQLRSPARRLSLAKKLFPSGRKVFQNMKIRSIAIYLVAAALICLASGVSAKADDIQTVGEYNGIVDSGDPGPFDPPTVVGTFNILAGDTSLTISGFFGNSVVPNSSGVQIFLGSILVAECVEFTTCYTGLTPTTWSDTLTGTDLASLGTGTVDLTAVQTSQFTVRLGVTTLDQVTATPEPSSLAFLSLGVFGLAALKLGKK